MVLRAVANTGGAGGASGPLDIAFAESIPLTTTRPAYMPQQTVSGPLAFTIAAGAVRGALVYLRLVANGTNTPTFTGFKEWGGSLGYDNRNGIVNQVQFFYDGEDHWVSFSQEVDAEALPAAASAITMTGPTGGVVSVASTNFTVGVSPVGGTITGTVVVTPSDGGAGGTFTPTTVSLTEAAPTATFTYTPASTGAKTISATNNGGLTNPANIVYTATATEDYLRLTSLVGATESGTGPYTYTATGQDYPAPTGGAGPGGVATKSLQSGADGSVAFQFSGLTTTSGPLLGLSTASGNTNWSYLTYVLYAKPGASPVYATMNGTGAGATWVTTAHVPMNGDRMRLRKSGTSMIAEFAREATPDTWTTVRTWTSINTGAIYPNAFTGSACTLTNLAGVGLA